MCMASVSLFPPPKAPTPAPQQGKKKNAVYVAAVPLRAVKGPAQMLASAAYSLGFWDLQHFMVIIKPDPSQPQALVYDFQPQDPENVYVALAALSGRQVPGVILERTLRRIPKSRCWFVGFTDTDGVDVASIFNEDWPTNLVIGEHDCRHYANGLVERLTGEQYVLDYLRVTNST